MVDRPGVEAQWCVERTGTNRPRTWLKQTESLTLNAQEHEYRKVWYVKKEKFRVGEGISEQISKSRRNVKKRYFLCSCQDTKSWKVNNSVAMAVGIHLFPCRTQQLSLQTPKVLGGRLPGRIGSRWLVKKTHRSFLMRLFSVMWVYPVELVILAK